MSHSSHNHEAEKAAESSGQQHPDSYQNDLNPLPLAGSNFGMEGPHPEKMGLTAADIKEVGNRYPDFNKEELRQIVIIPDGSRLSQGATYFDLQNPDDGEIHATSDMVSGPYNWFVPKSEMDYQLWNRLIGVDQPERIGEAGDA